MLLPKKIAEQVATGSVSVAYRRWVQPRVKVGSQFRTVAGVVEVTAVDRVDDSAFTDADAAAAGYADAAALRTSLRPRKDAGEESVYRIGVRYAGEDPRIALRNAATLSAQEVADLDTRLERLDRASSHGPWTMLTLALVRDNPERRAPDLAAAVGRERDPFKLDVRKLKNLGLTQSFSVGYALSPRGSAYLAATGRQVVDPPPVG